MLTDLIEVRLEVDRSAEAEIVGLRARLFRELAEQGLRIVDAEEATAAVEVVGRVDVRVLQAEATAEVVDSGRDEEDGVAASWRRPAFDEIENRKIRTSDGAD